MPFPSLTPDDAREAFQSEIPHRRDDLREAIGKLKEHHAKQGTVFSKYVHDVSRIAKLEMRERHAAAGRAIQSLIDSGWTPTTADTITGIYESLFSRFESADNDPFSDLKNAVDAAFGDIGGNGVDIRATFAREIQDVQVRAYKSAVAALRFYRPGMASGAMIFNAPVGLVQSGDANLGIVQQVHNQQT